MPRISSSGKTAIAASQWLKWADQDYLAARSLLLGRLLVHGAGFSNTAIEKYLKTIMVVKSIPFPRGAQGHNVVLLYDKLSRGGIPLHLRREYLELLVKAYRLRYPDDLAEGFNVAFSQAKMLAELDTTIFELRKGFNFRQGDKPLRTLLDAFVDEKDPRLLQNNSQFGTTPRSELFTQLRSCHELRVFQGTILEAEYEVEAAVDDGKFDVEALRPS